MCTKTLYNYIYLGLLPSKSDYLPQNMYRNTTSTRVKTPKKVLGKSIKEKPREIESK